MEIIPYLNPPLKLFEMSGNGNLTCVKTLLDNPFNNLTTHQDVIVSIHYIKRTQLNYQVRLGMTDEEMVHIRNFSIPCALNTTYTDMRDSVNINTTLGTLQSKCFGENCTSFTCLDKDLDAIIFWIMIMISVFMLLTTCFFRKRKNCCLWCCWGRPGPVIPLNMLDAYDNRVGLALTFGLTATKCLSVLFTDYERIFGSDWGAQIRVLPSYLSVFIKFLCTLLISQLAYPFFICQNMRNKFMGSIIGLILCVVWFSLEMFKIFLMYRTCGDIWMKATGGIGLFGFLRFLLDLPLYICLLLLAAKFAYVIFMTLKLRMEKLKDGKKFDWILNNERDWRTKYVYIHVRGLLTPKQYEDHYLTSLNSKETSFIQNIKKFLWDKCYTRNYEFRYSTRMIGSFVVAFVAVVNVSTTIATFGYLVFTRSFEVIFSDERRILLAQLMGIEEVKLMFFFHGIRASWWIAAAGAAIFSTAVLLNSLALYRSHHIMLRQGDRSFLPMSLRKRIENPGSLMNASMKSAGYQVGYAVWGFIVNFLVLFLLCIVIHTQIIWAIRFKQITFAIYFLKIFWPTLIITLVVVLSQRFFATVCFLRDADTVAVDNRRAYHITVYYMFFFNIFLGLLSCLLRIIYGLLFGMLFLQRLQKSTLPQSHEEIDPGYFAYLSYLLVEHQHANLVLQVFTRFLLESQDFKVGRSEADVYIDETGKESQLVEKMVCDGLVPSREFIEIKDSTLRKKRARIRWHLYVVLLANPSLRKFRKCFHKPRNQIRSNAAFFNDRTYNDNNFAAKCMYQNDCGNEKGDTYGTFIGGERRRDVPSVSENNGESKKEVLLLELATKFKNPSLPQVNVKHPNAALASDEENDNKNSLSANDPDVLTSDTGSRNSTPFTNKNTKQNHIDFI